MTGQATCGNSKTRSNGRLRSKPAANCTSNCRPSGQRLAPWLRAQRPPFAIPAGSVLPEGQNMENYVAQIERSLLQSALGQTHGVQVKAAEFSVSPTARSGT